jgi:uncharacterized protein (DUF433 family)
MKNAVIYSHILISIWEVLEKVTNKYSSSEIVEKQPEIRKDFIESLIEEYKKYGVMITKVYFSPVTKTQL